MMQVTIGWNECVSVKLTAIGAKILNSFTDGEEWLSGDIYSTTLSHLVDVFRNQLELGKEMPFCSTLTLDSSKYDQFAIERNYA